MDSFSPADLLKGDPEERRDSWEMPAWPFRLVAVGPSASGKTHAIMDMVRNRLDFDTLIVIAKDTTEPHYKLLKIWARLMMAGRDHENDTRKRNRKNPLPPLQPFRFVFKNSMDDCPSMDYWDGGNADSDDSDDDAAVGPPAPPPDVLGYKRLSLLLPEWESRRTLIIFDDMILEKKQGKAEELFIRGRKRNISTIYITQMYFWLSDALKMNMSSCMLFKTPQRRNVVSISQTLGSRFDYKVFRQLYKMATEDQYNFLFINEADPDPMTGCRINWDNFFMGGNE